MKKTGKINPKEEKPKREPANKSKTTPERKAITKELFGDKDRLRTKSRPKTKLKPKKDWAKAKIITSKKSNKYFIDKLINCQIVFCFLIFQFLCPSAI